MTAQPLWSPSPERAANALTTGFIQRANERHGLSLGDYASLHAWSVDRMEDFWTLFWEFAGIAGTTGPRALADKDKMPGARFFPEGKLNFAENLLRPHSGVRGREAPAGSDDASDAIVFWGEEIGRASCRERV